MRMRSVCHRPFLFLYFVKTKKPMSIDTMPVTAHGEMNIAAQAPCSADLPSMVAEIQYSKYEKIYGARSKNPIRLPG